MSEQLKYGYVRGGRVSAPSTWVGSDVLKAQSGRFVIKSGNSVTIATDGSAPILGHADDSERTTVALDPVNIIVDPSAVYRIPVNAGTYVVAMQFKTCDLSVSSNIQGADLTAATDAVFIVIDGDSVDNNWVDVMINPVRATALSGVV